MLILTAFVTIIVIVAFSLAIGFVAQYRWTKKQRAKYQVLHAKKLAGNIQHLELCWLNAAEDHKYKTFASFLRSKRRRWVSNVTRRYHDFMKAVEEFKRNIKEPKTMATNPAARPPNFEVKPASSGDWSPSSDKGKWSLLDTEKLREDAMCFDESWREDEEKRTGKKCDIPFVGTAKTESELQAEAMLDGKDITEEAEELKKGH